MSGFTNITVRNVGCPNNFYPRQRPTVIVYWQLDDGPVSSYAVRPGTVPESPGARPSVSNQNIPVGAVFWAEVVYPRAGSTGLSNRTVAVAALGVNSVLLSNDCTARTTNAALGAGGLLGEFIGALAARMAVRPECVVVLPPIVVSGHRFC